MDKHKKKFLQAVHFFSKEVVQRIALPSQVPTPHRRVCTLVLCFPVLCAPTDLRKEQGYGQAQEEVLAGNPLEKKVGFS